jgi:hypothetical protein
MVGEVTTIREQLRSPAYEGERMVTSAALVTPISWSAVFAGWAVGFGCQLVLTALGAGIGFAAIEPAVGKDPGVGFAIGAGIWWLLTGLISLFMGGLLAGRMAHVTSPSHGTLHGLLVWAVAAVAGVALLATSAATLAGGALGPMSRGIEQAASFTPTQTGDDVSSGLGTIGREVVNQASRGGSESVVGSAGSPQEGSTRLTADNAADAMASASVWTFFGLMLGAMAAAAGGAAGRPSRRVASLNRSAVPNRSMP